MFQVKLLIVQEDQILVCHSFEVEILHCVVKVQIVRVDVFDYLRLRIQIVFFQLLLQVLVLKVFARHEERI